MTINSKNILYIIIVMVCLAIIGVVIYLITKPKSTPTPPSNQICSVSNQNGICPDTYKCVLGMCTTSVPPSLSCSKSNPTGKCNTLGWICQDGTCTDPICSPSCQDGKSCVAGTCIDPATICSPSNLTGICPDKMQTCNAGRCCNLSCEQQMCGEFNDCGHVCKGHCPQPSQKCTADGKCV